MFRVYPNTKLWSLEVNQGQEEYLLKLYIDIWKRLDSMAAECPDFDQITQASDAKFESKSIYSILSGILRKYYKMEIDLNVIQSDQNH